jgi:ubiquinone/menaquinone biosynthesis C-methylase UbiE
MVVAASMGDVNERLAELSGAAWTLAAVAAAVEVDLPEFMGTPCDAASLAALTGLTEPLAARLGEALVAAGLAQRDGGMFVAGAGLAQAWKRDAGRVLQADLRTGLLQSAALVEDAIGGRLSAGWAHVDERVLQAQGTMSAGAVDFIEEHLLPRLDGLTQRLDSGDGAFLDVGAGVGAITIAFCQRHPSLRAVSLEPQQAPFELARANIVAAGLSDRVALRQQLVQELNDEASFDLAWLPGNFLPPAVLPSALGAVHRALRPGGWLLNACLGGGDDSPRAAAARLRAVLWGGDTMEPEQVAALLIEQGYANVRLLPRMAGGLVPMVGQRP